MYEKIQMWTSHNRKESDLQNQGKGNNGNYTKTPFTGKQLGLLRVADRGGFLYPHLL